MYTQYGPGDSITWPAYSGHPNDPRAPEPVFCPECGSDDTTAATWRGEYEFKCHECGHREIRRLDDFE